MTSGSHGIANTDLELTTPADEPVTVMAALYTVTQRFETLTQYDVVTDGLTTIQLFVAPAIGLLVLPRAPRYHWNVCGTVPIVVMLSSVPVLILRENGPLILGATHEFEPTVIAALFVEPHAFVTRTQNCVGLGGLTTTQLFLAPTTGIFAQVGKDMVDRTHPRTTGTSAGSCRSW